MANAIPELELDSLESIAENATGHRTALLAGFLGWMLDAFDFFLVVFCLTAIARVPSDRPCNRAFDHADPRLASTRCPYLWSSGR